MPRWQNWIDRFHSRVLWGEFLKRVGDGLAAFLLTFGTAVLLVRLLTPGLWPHVLWLLLGSIPVAAVAWWWARKQVQSPRETVAMLDRALSAGGLLMTLHERPDTDWSKHLSRWEAGWTEALPRYRPTRFLRCVAIPMVFALAVCFVPLREARSTPIIPHEVAQSTTQQLEELKSELAAEQILEEEEQKQIEEEVDRLKTETKGSPLTHENWETVDALREKMLQKLDEASLDAQKQASALAQLAEEAAREQEESGRTSGTGGSSANGKNGEKGEAGETSSSDEAVQNAIEEMIKREERKQSRLAPGQKSKTPLHEKLERLMKNGKAQLPSDPQERQELLDELMDELKKEQKKLEELRQKCKKCEGGQCENGQCESDSFDPTQRDGKDGKPGRGGVTRGRGDAEMTWGKESDEQGLKFKETVLPQGTLEDPGDEVVDVRKSVPIAEPAESAARGAARNVDTATGTTTWQRRLSPKHRAVVKDYFNGK